MVELCELKLLNGPAMGGEEWPPDIDEHVAQLDFAQSSHSLGRSSLFASMTLEPSVMNSTDSLDMEQLRIRCCETNKNDYKLTFEDSGQWTTSGFGGSTTNSPPTPTGGVRQRVRGRQRLYVEGSHPVGLRLLEELNNEQSDDECEGGARRLDELLNNSAANAPAPLTTWGRMRPADAPPPFEEKTYSLPSLSQRSSDCCRPGSRRRPLSDAGPPAPPRPLSLLATFVERSGAAHSQRPLGGARHVDVNDNELHFPSDATAAAGQHRHADRWRQRGADVSSSPRTFAELAGSATAPDLKFLSLAHEVPSFCRSGLSLDDVLKCGDVLAAAAECGQGLLASGCSTRLPCAGVLDGPDSGLGGSSSAAATASCGPTHIDDWPSLSALLPRHVVDACSFFKHNSSLLTGSSPSACCCVDNNIERKLPRCCCRCDASQATSQPLLAEAEGRRPQTLHAQELALVGLPLYEAKRRLVECAVEGVAEVRRGASAVVLCSALERLLADGLLAGLSVWHVVVATTTTTERLHPPLVKALHGCAEGQRLQRFLRQLTGTHSLDHWLTRLALQERTLAQLYADDAFLRGAHGVYRSLFQRLVGSVELLAAPGQHRRPARVPADSRVPRSSSFPVRMAAAAGGLASRIPVRAAAAAVGCPSPHAWQRRQPANDTTSLTVVACVREPTAARGTRWLRCEAGEHVRILSIRGAWSRCARLHARHGLVTNGLVPTRVLHLC